MTRLANLDASFVHLESPDGAFREVSTIGEANGVLFDCPKCGRHSVLCWSRSRGVPDGIEPGPGRWEMTGSGLDDLTLSPSIDLSRNGSGCGWHGWVKNGDAA